MIFNIVKDLFNEIERLSRSGKVQIGSKSEGIRNDRSKWSEVEELY